MLIKKYFKYGIFTSLKYLEYALTAFVVFSVSTLVSPAEYGKATTAFLVITYSLFGTLGINQVLLKWYSVHKKLIVRNFLLQYNFIYSIMSALIIAPVVFVLLGPLDYKFFVVMICVLKLLQDSVVNINRVLENVYTINAIYLSYSICFFILYISFVKDMASFFEMWSYSLFLSVVVAVISLLNVKHIFQKFNYFFFNLKKYFKSLIFDGFKLAIASFITPWLLTIDRVILINFTDIDKSLIGVIQLSDNIASVLTILFTSVIFIFSPQIIEKLHSGIWTIKYIYRKGLILLVILICLIFTGLFPLKLLTNWVFPQYQNLYYPMSFFLLIKTISVFSVIPNLICLAYSRELLYIKVSLISLALLIFFYIIATFFLNNISLFYVFPVILLVISIFLSIHSYFAVKNFKAIKNG